MGKQFRSFCFYYKCFFAEFFSQLWQSWHVEIWPAAVVAALVFFLSYRHDPNAAMAFAYTSGACLLYLVGWAIYHWIRTPWKLNQHPPVFRELVKSVHPVNLQGEILELYFHNENDLLGIPSHILMKVQIVNHGTIAATITKVGLQIRIGDYVSMCDLVKQFPDSWQIRHRDERYLNMVYINTPLEGEWLGGSPSEEIYRPAIPRSGWIAFELYAQANIQFPNAEFNLYLVDSLGGEHRIQRKPQLYTKTGDIVSVPVSSSTQSANRT